MDASEVVKPVKSAVINPHNSDANLEKIIIFLCDTPKPAVYSKHGSYHEIFSKLFQKSVTADPTIPPILLESFDVVDGEIPSRSVIKDAKGILLTGSACSAVEDKPWIKRLKNALSSTGYVDENIRLLGICFGHQLIAEAFGGKVVKNQNGWEFGVYQLSLNEQGGQIFNRNDTKTITIQEFHQDCVEKLPLNFISVASTEKTPNQIMLKRCSGDENQIQILGFQGHPEFLTDMINDMLDSVLTRHTLDAEFVEESRKRANGEHDGVWLGQFCLRMLLGLL